jgi:hypothetical protein
MPCPGADQARRQVDQQLVDAAFAHQRGVQLAPASTCSSLISRRPSSSISAGRSTLPAALGSRMISCPARAAPLPCPHRAAPRRSSTARPAGCARRGDLEPAVDDHAARLARRVDAAHGQLRIVGLDGADAGQDRAGAGAPGVAVGARLRAGDPLALAAVQRRGAVQAGRRLQAHPRPAARMREKKPIFSSCAGSASSPVLTAMPAASSCAMPRPATSGFGSPIAATTRPGRPRPARSSTAACGRSGCRVPA